MPIEVTVCQRSDEWYQARIGKVTASLAAACLGLDPYCSRMKAWRQIMGIEQERESRAMAWGTTHEAAARCEYEAHTGNLVETCGFYTHPELPWLGCSPDGLIGAEALVEIKCPYSAPAKVPVRHRIQVLVQLAVMGRAWAHYYAWGADGSRLLVKIHRAGIPGLLCRLERFYREFVVPGIEPPRKQRRSRK